MPTVTHLRVIDGGRKADITTQAFWDGLQALDVESSMVVIHPGAPAILSFTWNGWPRQVVGTNRRELLDRATEIVAMEPVRCPTS